jgi:hypothetical protein
MKGSMTINDYYRVLGLNSGSSIDEIKKAYRKKARLYHPDLNHSAEAKDLFISATEAYEFLIAYLNKLQTEEKTYEQVMEDWRKYRQDRSRKRATAYARAPYNTFKNTNFYKTTRIFDGTIIGFSIIISLMVIVLSIYGYNFRLHHSIPGVEKPTVFGLIMLLMLGTLFLAVSFIYLRAYQQTLKKNKKGHTRTA